MKLLSSKQADIMLFFVAFFWGTGFTVTKIGLEVFTTMQLLSIRFIIATIVSFILFHKNMKKANRQDLKAGIIMGIFLALGYVFQTVGLEGTTAGNSAFLTGTNVVMVPFFYYLVSKKKPGLNNTVAAGLMFIGIILLTVDFNNFGKFNFSDMLTFLCAISFAWQIVVTGIYASDKDPYVISTIQMTTSAVIFSVMMFFDKTPLTINLKGVVSMAYLSVVTTMLCFLMQTVAQKYTQTSHAAILLSLESVVGSIFGMIFLGEKYTVVMLFAFALIFLSILTAECDLGSLFKNRKFKKIYQNN